MKLTIRIILFIVLGLILLLVGFVFFLQTENGQKFVSKKVSGYLQNTLKTKIRAEIRYDFPDWISLEKVYLEDQKQDTLLIGDKLYADIDMWELILNNHVKTDKIIAENLKIKLNRTTKDFNYQFILDAFASDTTKAKQPTNPLNLALDEVDLKNISLIYNDQLLNNTAKLKLGHFKTNFQRINIEKGFYSLINIDLSDVDLVAKIEKIEADTTQKSSPLPDFRFNALALNNINYDIDYQPNKIKSKAKITKLDAVVDEFDLPKNEFKLAQIKLEKSEVSYQNLSQKPNTNGFDANYIELKDLTFDIQNLTSSPKQSSLQVKNLTFKDRSGLELQQLKTHVLFTPQKLALENFFLKTPETVLNNDVFVEYESIEKLSSDLGNTKITVNLKDSKVSMNDVFRFLPDLKQNAQLRKLQNEVFSVSGITNGKIEDLTLKNLTVSGLENTHLVVSGNIKNLTNTEKVNFQLFLNELNIQKNIIYKFLPDSTIPSNIELPNQLNFAGKFTGNLKNIYSEAHLSTDFGNANFVGNIAPSSISKGVEGEVKLQNFNLGKLLKQPEKIGEVSLKTDFSIQNYDVQKMVLDSKGTIEKAFYNNYNYQNIGFEATMRNQLFSLQSTATDPNLSLKINIQTDLSKLYPSAAGEAEILKVDLRKLNFYADSIALSGKIKFNIKDSNPDNFLGEISADNSVVYRNEKPIKLGDFVAKITPIAGGKGLKGHINSEFANLNLTTTTSQTDIGNAIFTEVNKYFALANIPYKPYEKPYRFLIDGTLNNHPALQAFVPQLKKLDTLTFHALVDSQADTTLQIDAFLPHAKLDSNVIQNLHFIAIGNGEETFYNADLQEFTNGGVRVRKANLKGEISNNIADFVFSVKDSLDKPIHGIAGNLKSENKHIIVGFQPSGSLLNYKNWNANQDGFIDYSDEGIIIRNLNFSSENQNLKVNSIEDKVNAPLKIQAENLNLQNLMIVVLQDSSLASGRIYGDGVFTMNNATFIGELQLKELAVKQIPVGELTLNLSNEKSDRINTYGTLRSADNYIDLSGDYLLEKKNPLDFTIDVRELSAKTVEAFSFGILQRTEGSLNGKLTIKGNTDSPKLNGDLSFNKVALVLPQTQSKYYIDKQKLTFDGSNVGLRNFIIKDTLNQSLVTDGTISLKNLPSFSYNLNIKANNFLALNTSRKDNDFVFGKAIVNPLLNVQGTDTHYKINGKVKVNAGSQLTMIMPDDVSEDESKEGIVKFINVKEEAAKKIEISKQAIQNKEVSSSIGEFSINVEADDQSELKIVIDELNGDYLKAKGNANMTTEINEAGQMTMLGSYKISEGTYEMTYQVLKKPFTIKKGSEITWTGDPLKGTMNITAEYAVKAPVYDLIAAYSKSDKSDKNYDVLKSDIPFSVNLIMSGELLNPKVDFGIVFDESYTNSLSDEVKGALEEALSDLQKNQVELKKQVFAVLMLNRFIPEKSSDFFSGVSAESIARQSVSKLLSEQLNNLAGDIIKGVKLDFNLASAYNSSADYRSTNLGVGLSKSFFNDRISVSVGRNFELENAQARSNEVFDNITVNYNLTKDGRYRFKAFRKNQFILEGFVVETGVGFTIALDFDQLKELIGKN